jgi:hypothetical protein
MTEAPPNALSILQLWNAISHFAGSTAVPLSRKALGHGIWFAISGTVFAQFQSPSPDPVTGFTPATELEAAPALGFGLQEATIPTDLAEPANPALGFGNLAPVPPPTPEPVEFPPSLEMPPPPESPQPSALPDPGAGRLDPEFFESLVDPATAPVDDRFATSPWWNFPGAAIGNAQAPGTLSARNHTFSGFTNGFASPYGWDDRLLDGIGLSASLTGTYDSNPSLGYGSPNHSDGGDFSMTLGGSAAYRTRGTEWTYGLNYSGSYNQYFSQSDLSGYSQSAGASVNYQGGPLTASFNLGVGFGSGANRYYESVVDELSVNYSLNASYQYSRKTTFNGNFSQSLTSPSGGFAATGSFNLGASALWRYSPRTQFGPGIRYSVESGDTQQDRTSIGPTMTVNYTLSKKVSLNSQVGLDFSQYEDGESADPSLSASIALNYRASSLWGLNLSLNTGTQASGTAAGQFEQRTSLRAGYNRRIRRASWNLGVSYENSSFEAPATVTGGADGSRDYMSFDTSLGMPVFADTCTASVFLRYSDQGRTNINSQQGSFQTGFSLSRSF